MDFQPPEKKLRTLATEPSVCVCGGGGGGGEHHLGLIKPNVALSPHKFQLDYIALEL